MYGTENTIFLADGLNDITELPTVLRPSNLIKSSSLKISEAGDLRTA